MRIRTVGGGGISVNTATSQQSVGWAVRVMECCDGVVEGRMENDVSSASD